MNPLTTFQVIAAVLAVLFLGYGMDIRRKTGARDFVAPVWQVLMKLCALALIGAFIGTVAAATHVGAIDWAGLVLIASGTTCVVAAKRALGNAHTFSGQHLAKPRLVTHGIYAFSRNPLYLGVFLCEAGAALFVVHQAPLQFPNSYAYWLPALVVALAYAVAFNLNMAQREARFLQTYFGDAYREYQARVSFLVPISKFHKEIE